jgi:amino acid adenylation domain-containing protein
VTADGGLPGTDERLRRLWSEALERDDTWPASATFVELGGYSLLALSLAGQLSREFGIDVPRTLLLEQPRFDSVVSWLDAHAAGSASATDSAPATGARVPSGTADRPAPGQAVAPFPMSALQQAYVLGETGGFDLACAAIFCEDYRTSELQLDRLVAAVDTLVQRHDMLRAAFGTDGLQRVLPSARQGLVEYRDLKGCSPTDTAEVLRDSWAELSRQVPAVEAGQPLTFRVFRLADCYRVQVRGRLLVFDGRSGEVFADELRALLAGHALPELGYTYRDYRSEMELRRSSQAYADARSYWSQRLPDLAPAPDLPARLGRRPANPGLTRRSLVLEAQRWNRFKARAGANGVTTTVALCEAFCEVLRLYAASPDFTLNIMYGERAPLHPDVPGIVGNFSDTLLLECRSAPESTFASRAKALGAQLMADLAHGAFGGVDAIRELNSLRGAGRSPVMPVVFASVIGGASTEGVFLERLGWQRVAGAISTPQVSFDHQVFDSNGTLVANWDTADGLFPDGLLDAMFATYEQVLDRLCSESGAWERSTLGTAPDDQLAVRARVNDTAAAIAPTTLHDPLFAAAARTPDALAVIAADRQLTFRELTEEASRVASALVRRGLRPGDLVLLHEERGWRQVVALLGILAAGGVYVPLGPTWPAPRIQKVLERSGAGWLVTGAHSELSWADGLQRVSVDRAEPASGDVELPTVDPESLAYVLYTSGTTGEPKGVMIRHQSAANTIVDLLSRFAVTAEDRVLGLSEVTFDLSVFDVFGPPSVGGALVVPEPAAVADVAALHELCESSQVSLWNSVPAYLDLLVDYRLSGKRQDLPALRLAMVSGDWVPVTLSGRLAATLPGVELISLGGATEASIWSNWFRVPADLPAEWNSVPYGVPLANQGFRVLDESMADRPDWVAGDLYITGRGLAEGYLNDVALSDAAFLRHPHEGMRLYRTGDRARYWPDGTLEFLGRRDGQVKVNGFRVELGDVESSLLAEPDVRAAVVVARRDARGASLSAHVVLDGARTGPELLSALRARLPDYLVPRSLSVHERLPLAANGKVDRARLAVLRPDESVPEPAVGPADEVEQRVLELWRALVPTPGVLDDFFACGGHSVSAAMLMNALERSFGVRLPLALLYRQRTVRALATALSDRGAGHQIALTGDEPGAVDLGPDGPVLMHLGGQGDPLVLIHPVGGDVLCYRSLVERLAGEYSVHGIAVGALGAGRTVTGMAHAYHRLITEALPGRAVGLAGWSFGALVGYEVARTALDRGDSWPVVMLDPWLARRPPPEVTDRQLMLSFLLDLSAGTLDPVGLSHLLDGDAPLDTHELLRDLVAQRPEFAGLDIDTVARLFAQYGANTEALLGYEIGGDAPPAVTVVTADGGFGAARPEYLQPLADSQAAGLFAGATWHRIAGDHYGIVDPNRSDEVAALVRQGLRP